MHARVVLGVGKGVLFIERCPQFRSLFMMFSSHKAVCLVNFNTVMR